MVSRIIKIIIELLILISIICFTIETIPGLSDSTMISLTIIQDIIIIIFTIEYIYNLLTTKDTTKFLLSFDNIVDLIVILPFYLALSLNLNIVKIFRLFKLAKILKLKPFQKAIKNLIDGYRLIQTELHVFFISSMFLLYLAATGIYYFEHEAQPEVFGSIFHSLWWGVVTLTTVGYGDMYPITVGGKLFTFVILLIGLGIVAVPTGLIATAFSKTINKDD